MRPRSTCLIVIFFPLLVAAVFFLWPRGPRMPEGLTERAATFGDRDVTFLVYRLPRSYAYEFAADPDAPRTVRQWREMLGADVVFNGSYFMENGITPGFWKTGKGTSAVPWPDRAAQADTHGYTFMLSLGSGSMEMAYLPHAPNEEPLGDTLLSFPTLVAAGEPIVGEDSGLLARRTAVAKDARGNDYLVVTKQGILSLYEFSRWLAEQPEEFVVAGNLDGGPSTGVSIENGEEDVDVPSAPVPNVMVGRPRSKSR